MADRPNPKPTVGRIVHLPGTHDGKDVPIACIITAVHEDGVSLTGFVPDHLPGYIKGRIPYSHESAIGHWSWPPRD
jgi:hypothetical protein